MTRYLAPLLLLLCAGCLYQPHDVTPPAPPDKPVVADSIFCALADRVDAGAIANTDDLLNTVKELKASGDITEAQSDAFAKALPDLAKKQTALDTAEARKPISDKLRGLP